MAGIGAPVGEHVAASPEFDRSHCVGIQKLDDGEALASFIPISSPAASEKLAGRIFSKALSLDRLPEVLPITHLIRDSYRFIFSSYGEMSPESATPVFQSDGSRASTRSSLRKSGSPKKTAPVRFVPVTYGSDGWPRYLGEGRPASYSPLIDAGRMEEIRERNELYDAARRDSARRFPVYDAKNELIGVRERTVDDFLREFEKNVDLIDEATSARIAASLWETCFKLIGIAELRDHDYTHGYALSDKMEGRWEKTVMLFEGHFPLCHLIEDLKYHEWDQLGRPEIFEEGIGGEKLKSRNWVDLDASEAMLKLNGCHLRYWGYQGETSRHALEAVGSLTSSLYSLYKSYRSQMIREATGSSFHVIPTIDENFESFFRDYHSYENSSSESDSHAFFYRASEKIHMIKWHMKAALLMTQALLMPRDESISKEDHREIIQDLYTQLPRSLKNRMNEQIGRPAEGRDAARIRGERIFREDPFATIVIRAIREIRFAFLMIFSDFLLYRK